MTVGNQLKYSLSQLGFVGENPNLSLHLQSNFTFFRYFILSENRVVYFANYTLHHVFNETDWRQQMEIIFESDLQLKKNFEQIFCLLDTPYEIIPATFFESELASFHACKLNSSKAFFQFEKSPYSEQIFQQYFSSISFSHTVFSLLQVCQTQLKSMAENLLVQVDLNHLTIIYFNQNGHLQFCNTFEYKTDSDFIYFVLLVSNELHLDREKIKLILCGEINMNSKIYTQCYKYFANIAFYSPPLNIKFDHSFDTFQKYLYPHLVHQQLAEIQ